MYIYKTRVLEASLAFKSVKVQCIDQVKHDQEWQLKSLE